MKNYIQEGKCLDLTVAGTAVASGDARMIGGLLCVAVTDGEVGDVIAWATEGVYELPKDLVADFAEGEICYFDSAEGRFEDTALGLYPAATCVKAAAAADATVLVKLVGHAVDAA